MTPERWRQITELFHAARERDPARREIFLADACREDPALQREVAAMLAGHEHAGQFGEVPLFTPASRLEPGFSLGPYRIERMIGAGGMGEVYRARDTKLGRDVAIKILPRVFTSDPERLARFEREARMLAALNHPHIGAIYGMEDADGVRGLVLELVEGPTLADRLVAGPLPVTEALTVARQIVDALEAAHEKGIVHRDLKPANITLTPDGVVKVLDFGLAKVFAGEATGPDLTQSPTITVGATREGVLLGTVAYMSPEQARGLAVDKRTDIWAFGCVLFEMLTGGAVVAGNTVSDTIVAILEREPAWDQLPDATPHNIRQLLRRCLDKDSKRRLRDIGDARIEIDDSRADPVIVESPERHKRSMRMAPWTAAALCLVAAVILARSYLQTVPPPGGEATRFSVSPADLVLRRGLLALSPVGRRLAFVARRDGVPMIWVRALEAIEAQPLLGSEDATSVFWSPDGQSLAFFTPKDGLKIMDEFGRGVRTVGALEAMTTFYGGMWTPDGRIVVGSIRRGLFAISAKGGSSSPITRLDVAHGEGGHIFPTMLPDGRHFLYLSEPSSTIWIGALGSTEATRLMSADSQAVYVAAGYLLFVRRQTLFAQPFDPSRLKLTGEPVVVAEGVLTEVNYGADFTASLDGILAYRTGTIHVPTQLIWVDRAGKRLRTVGPPGRYANIELSPDGTRVALEAFDARTFTKDIWIMELGRGVLTQLTFDSSNETFPIWSPEGDWIMFGSDREGGWQLYQRRTNGTGSDERVVMSSESMVPQSWAPDGLSVVYLQRPANLGMLPLAGARTPRLFDEARFEGSGRNDGHAQVSPNGHWLAYASNESGQWQIRVRSYPEPDGGRRQISTAGGISPVWRRDGRELFYYSGEGRLVAVSIAADKALTIGAAVPLFTANLLGGPSSAIPWRTQYAASPDGQRFLLNEPVEDAYAYAPITVVTNWMAALKK
jgi:serine/threonine protein kinase/Tol biopolymer transport system component